MNTAISLILALVALVNFAPVVGVFSAARLESMYGTSIAGSDLAILMRHRALLFGIVGGLLAAAVFNPRLRTAAIAAGFVSMLSFVAIAFAEGGGNRQIVTVARIDIAASLLLAIAAVMHWKESA